MALTCTQFQIINFSWKIIQKTLPPMNFNAIFTCCGWNHILLLREQEHRAQNQWTQKRYTKVTLTWLYVNVLYYVCMVGLRCLQKFNISRGFLLFSLNSVCLCMRIHSARQRLFVRTLRKTNHPIWIIIFQHVLNLYFIIISPKICT